MKRVFASIFLLLGIGVAATAEASWLSSIWDTTKSVVSGAVDLSLHLANSITSMVGIHLINESTSAFENRLASYTQNSCWFCGVLGDAFDIMNDIVTQMCSSLKPIFLTLLGLGLLFWLLFNVGKKVIDFSGKSSVISDTLKEVMRVSVAALLITFYYNVFYYAINPMLELGIGLGNQITSQELKGYTIKASRSGAGAPSSRTVSLGEETLCEDLQMAIAKEASNASRGKAGGKEGEKVFSDVTKESFLCYVRMGSASLAVGMAIGSTAIHAWSDMGLLDKLRHMQLPMIGLIIFLSFFALFVAFPLKLFDPLVNLTFVSAMFPLWVVMWAFPGFGKNYYQKAIEMFSGIIVHLIVISVMAVVCINIMNSALGSKQERDAMYQALKDGKRAAAIFEGVGETGWGAALGGFGLVGKATLMTAALGYFAFQLFKKTDKVAGQFSKGVINFGVNEGANAMFGGAGASVIKGGASAASAAWHTAAPNSSDVVNSTRENTRLGTFTRRAMAMGALGPIGAAAAVRRFQKTPAYTGEGTKDTLRTSRLGTAVGRVRSWFGGARPNFVKRREKDGVFRLDTKTGIHTKTAKDGSVSRYDSHKGTYTKTDRSGKEVSSYDFNTGAVKLNGQNYTIDRTGAVLDSNGGAVSDAAVAASVRGVQAEAEAGKTRMEQLLRERKVENA